MDHRLLSERPQPKQLRVTLAERLLSQATHLALADKAAQKVSSPLLHLMEDGHV